MRIENAEALGPFIKKARESKGWSQHDLARHSHVAQSTISRLERNLAVPDLEIMLSVLTALCYGLELLSPEEMEDVCGS